MRWRRLLAATLHDMGRHAGHLLLAGTGVVVGVAAFVFFLGLGTGAREILLDRVTPERYLEVEPSGMEVGFGPIRLGVGGVSVDDALLSRVGSLTGVAGVYPRTRLRVPAMASGGGGLLGSDVVTELPVDGLDPAALPASSPASVAFADPGEGESGIPCIRDAECGPASHCSTGLHGGAWRCRADVPVVASPLLLDLYNRGVRHAHGLPRLDPEVVVGLRFDLYLGASALGDSGRRVRRRAVVVGVSPLAASVGVSVPLPVVQRANDVLAGDIDRTTYDALVVELRRAADLGAVSRALKDMGLRPVHDAARRAANVVTLVTLVLGLVSVAILVTSGLHVMHVFLMLVAERRREIAVMRALGASRRDITAMMVAEATAVGAAAGLVGAVVGAAGLVAAARAAAGLLAGPVSGVGEGALVATVVPVVVGGVVLAVVCCAAGALLPARRAARPWPYELLRGR